MRWPLQPLQPLQQTQLQPPFGQSVASLCHPWFTTTNVSYRFPVLKLPPPPCAVLLVLVVVNRSISCFFQGNIIFRNLPDQNTGNGIEMPGIWMAKNIKILHQDWPPGHLPKYDACLVVWILMFLQCAGKTMPIRVKTHLNPNHQSLPPIPKPRPNTKK